METKKETYFPTIYPGETIMEELQHLFGKKKKKIKIKIPNILEELRNVMDFQWDLERNTLIVCFGQRSMGENEIPLQIKVIHEENNLRFSDCGIASLHLKAVNLNFNEITEPIISNLKNLYGFTIINNEIVTKSSFSNAATGLLRIILSISAIGQIESLKIIETSNLSIRCAHTYEKFILRRTSDLGLYAHIIQEEINQFENKKRSSKQ